MMRKSNIDLTHSSHFLPVYFTTLIIFSDVQRQLNRLRDVHNKRMENLRTKHKPTYDAVQWLRENKHRFRGEIYEPMMLLVGVSAITVLSCVYPLIILTLESRSSH